MCESVADISKVNGADICKGVAFAYALFYYFYTCVQKFYVCVYDKR